MTTGRINQVTTSIPLSSDTQCLKTPFFDGSFFAVLVKHFKNPRPKSVFYNSSDP
jgi:hypothetical protein